MQVRELVKMAAFLKAFLQDKNMSELYQNLISAINEAANNSNPENVKTQRDILIAAQKQAAAQSLSPAQDKLIGHYGADILLGSQAVERIENIFSEHQAHPQGLSNALNQMKRETDKLGRRATQLIEVLDPMLDEKVIDEAELGDNEGRLWLYFSRAAAVENIDQLEVVSKTWKSILHNFSRLPDASAGNGRLLQIRKHSPLEIELAASIALLTPLAFGITWLLSRVEQVIQIRQEAEKLKQLQVKTQIVKSLHKEAEERREAIADEAADEIRAKYNADGEVRNAVRQALAKVLNFIEEGGELDIDVKAEDPAEDEDQNPGSEISGLIENIRDEIRLLSHIPKEGDVDADRNDEVKD